MVKNTFKELNNQFKQTPITQNLSFRNDKNETSKSY